MPGKYLTIAVAVILGALSSTSLSGQQPQQGFSVISPFKSEHKTRQLISTIVLDALRNHMAKHGDDPAGEGAN